MKAASEQAADAAVQEGIPADEADRLACLYRLGLLDSASTDAFDAVARLAATRLQVPIVLCSAG